jgi:dethiobiotin synthetase
MAAVEDNLETLRAMLPAPCLGVLPHGVDPAQAAGRLELAPLFEHQAIS